MDSATRVKPRGRGSAASACLKAQAMHGMQKCSASSVLSVLVAMQDAVNGAERSQQAGLAGRGAVHKTILAEWCQRMGLTLKVDESLELKRSWDVQAGSMHPTDGSHVSELPVSKQPVNCLGGVPRWNSP